MHKLKVELKQHTPLIHFQHDQEGATLRASEVKPKFDRYILGKLNPEERRLGEKQGWIKSKNGKTWLVYKMRIDSSAFQSISIPTRPVKKGGVLQTDSIGRQLFSTNNYPDNDSSLIMSNIGGRVEEEVFNLRMANSIILTLRTDDTADTLASILKDRIYEFFARTSFGNRTSKGFGSFEVVRINDNEENSYLDSDSYILSFTIQAKDPLNINSVYKSVFKVIHAFWKQLKRLSGVRGKAVNNVLLNMKPQNISGAERIPSPIRFKPLVDFYTDGNFFCCDVSIAFFYNEGVISKVADLKNVSYYAGLLDAFKKDAENQLFEFLRKNVSYDINPSSVSLE